jgi:signal transduction histidine kinase
MLYALLVNVVFASFFGKGNLSSEEQISYLLASLAIGLTFTPLKKFFDKWSKKIFYRDMYDPQQLLDELNKVLVKDIDLKNLLQNSSNIIRDNMKADYVAFGITASQDSNFRVFGADHFILSEDDLKILKHSFSSKRKVIELSDLDEHNQNIYDLLKSRSIMAIAALSTRSGHLGYIFLGNKKSGNLYSKDDLHMLQLMADELAIATQNALHFEEIQKFNITLQDKVDLATTQLRHANVRLKELDKTKNEFISMASHQLRTPLTTIKGYLSMILEGDVGKVKAAEKDMIQQAYDSAQNMVDLIADLLNVSRLQSGKFVIENKPTDLADMIDREIKKLREQAANRKIKLSYDKPASIPILSLDETKMRQVVMNFIDNAIYYTPPGGSIRVALEASPQSVKYTVTDTGLGVPANVQHHLFSKFYRAENAKKMRPDGTGLGLFMAKKVIVAQGGAIIFKSEEGKGSTFGFSFPRKNTEVKK